MANAQWTPVSISTLLDTAAWKNVYVISSIVRKYPLLAYFWFNIPNHYKEAILWDKLSYNDAASIDFKQVNWIKPTLSEDGSKISWYEASTFSNIQLISANSITTDVVLADVKWFAVWDVVLTVPWSLSAGTRVQAKITWINTWTKTVTLNSAVNVKTWDKLMFLYPSFTYNTKVTRTVAEDDATPVTTYLQKFGWSFSYDIQELNKVYLFTDASQKVKNKLAQATNQAINNFAYAFYNGRNIAWANAETDGLERVIAEKAAKWENVVRTITWATDADKIKFIQDMLVDASSAQVYIGNEQPTWIINDKMVQFLSSLLQSSIQHQNMVEKEIDWGLKTFSSPFYKNINFIVDQTLNQLYPFTSVWFLVPKHLISFMSPTYDIPDTAWVQKTYSNNWFKMVKQPITTGDSAEWTLEQWIANIFAWQSYTNSYMKFTV